MSEESTGNGKIEKDKPERGISWAEPAVGAVALLLLLKYVGSALGAPKEIRADKIRAGMANNNILQSRHPHQTRPNIGGRNFNIPLPERTRELMRTLKK